MKTPHMDDVLAVLEPGTHPGNTRHRPKAHHWSATVLVVMVSAGLIVLLIIANHQVAAPKFAAPSQPLNTEAATTASGIATDFSQINASDLPDSTLSPVAGSSTSGPRL